MPQTRDELIRSGLWILLQDQTGVGIDVRPDFWMEAYMQRQEWEHRIGVIVDLCLKERTG